MLVQIVRWHWVAAVANVVEDHHAAFAPKTHPLVREEKTVLLYLLAVTWGRVVRERGALFTPSVSSLQAGHHFWLNWQAPPHNKFGVVRATQALPFVVISVAVRPQRQAFAICVVGAWLTHQ